MSLSVDRSQTLEIDALELVESCLTEAGWDFQRDEDDETLQCIAASKWENIFSMTSTLVMEWRFFRKLLFRVLF